MRIRRRLLRTAFGNRVSVHAVPAHCPPWFDWCAVADHRYNKYLLDELKNDITRETPASFEPSIDYVVTKIPRFAFEKFPQADPTLTTQMKSVGEAMAIGRTFKESLQKCLRSLEIGRSGLGGDGKPWRIGTEVYGDRDILPRDVISRKLSVPNAERIFFIRHALRAGFTIEEIFNLTKIDRWFLVQIKEIVDFEEELAGAKN